MAATSTNQQNNLYPDLEAATERVREANERFAEAGRKVTSAYLDGIEKYVGGLTQFERKITPDHLAKHSAIIGMNFLFEPIESNRNWGQRRA